MFSKSVWLCLALLLFAACADGDGEALVESHGLLVWVAEVEGVWDIYLRETPDGETARLTRDPAWDWGPALSPDGGRLAWLSTRDGQEDIYLAELRDGALGSVRRLTDDLHREGFLAWEPSGEALFYTALDYDGTGKMEFYDIYRVEVSGGGPTLLTGRRAEDPGEFFAPAPLGERLYALRRPYGGGEYLLVELLAGESRPVLLEGEPVMIHEYADASPAQPRPLAGDRLMIVRSLNGEARLSIIDPLEGIVIDESPIDPTACFFPVPADSDGELFYFATAADDDAELALGSLVDPSLVVPLTDNEHFDGYPCWVPLTTGD